MKSIASKLGMIELDRRAVAGYLPINAMMELAGAGMLQLFGLLELDQSHKVTIFCGKGNKGGDGLSAARHLVNNGYDVLVFLLERPNTDEAKNQLALLETTTAGIVEAPALDQISTALASGGVAIDALIGYNFRPPLSGSYYMAVKLLNSAETVNISIDMPTGLTADAGKQGEHVVADASLIFAIPKQSYEQSAQDFGKSYLVDLGIPAKIYAESGLVRPDFSGNLLKLI